MNSALGQQASASVPIDLQDSVLPTIFYGVAGFGRGHANRAITILRDMEKTQAVRFVFFSSGHAYDYLEQQIRPPHQLIRIPVPSFIFGSSGRIDFIKTAIEFIRYKLSSSRWLPPLRQRIQGEQPVMIISDFEPALARLAREHQRPLLIVDHQSLFAMTPASSIPLPQQLGFWLTRSVVSLFYRRGFDKRLVCSFSAPQEQETLKNTQFIGSLLSDDLPDEKPLINQVLVYYVAKIPESVLKVLANSPVPVHLYGQGERESIGSCHFFPVNRKGFLADLSQSRLLVCSTGNQLLSEALHYRIPILSISMNNQPEQKLNGHFLAHEAGCKVCDWDGFSTEFHTMLKAPIQRIQRPPQKNGIATIRHEICNYLTPKSHCSSAVDV